MGLAVKIWLALLLIGFTHIVTCTDTAKNLWEHQLPEDAAWSYSRFTREAVTRNTFDNVFRPLKCNPQARDLKACAVEDETNDTICLLMGCCFKDRPEKPCYKMTINKPKQILNILGVGSVSLAFIAICPLLFCLLTERTKMNPLLRKNQKIEDAKMKDTKLGAYVLSVLQEHKKKQKTERKPSIPTGVPSADISHSSTFG
ncbi:fragile X mental retardation 1 neighbor protein-like [Scyliorhinus canicula]|uniref:fragile X mental retardation 1 neighbor protein-like n=1 Tax=Scyliorhinus canicula TaxID=7830 RepID=UPI0018F513EA|nr:fragile X mental retardation 1 neighbor protein-like [Scyliorhinus canicula]